VYGPKREDRRSETDDGQGSVLLVSRMMNLRANASSAISMTVRSWMMLSCRCIDAAQS
jgi:hypothetical protein